MIDGLLGDASVFAFEVEYVLILSMPRSTNVDCKDLKRLSVCLGGDIVR